MLFTILAFHTLRIYDMYRTYMFCFLYHTHMVVPYGTYVSHSMKLSIETGGSMQSLIAQ